MTVTVVLAVGLCGLTVRDAAPKVHEPPDGSAEHAVGPRLKVPLKPFTDVSVRVVVPVVGEFNTFVISTGPDASRLKSGAIEDPAHPLAFTRFATLTEPQPVVKS